MFFMPELSKWMRAKTSARRVTETDEAAGKETVSVGSERGGKKAAGQLPELVRSSQRERKRRPASDVDAAKENMEFIKRLVTYNTKYRINWIEEANV